MRWKYPQLPSDHKRVELHRASLSPTPRNSRWQLEISCGRTRELRLELLRHAAFSCHQEPLVSLRSGYELATVVASSSIHPPAVPTDRIPIRLPPFPLLPPKN